MFRDEKLVRTYVELWAPGKCLITEIRQKPLLEVDEGRGEFEAVVGVKLVENTMENAKVLSIHFRWAANGQGNTILSYKEPTRESQHDIRETGTFI